MLKPDQIDRALVITAHPDDVDFGAAGTVAELTDAGAAVTYCLVTDGQAGGHDVTVPRDQMAATRRAEQTQAAAAVGVTDLRFLGYQDGSVEYTLELRGALSRVIREVRPQVVIAHSPTINVASAYASHPDHVATGQAAFAAVYPDARNPFAHTELLAGGLEPWAVDELWVMHGDATNDGVEITRQVERKLAALMSHVSQHLDPSAIGERIRTWNESNAASIGLPEGSAAELFYVVDTR